ncbi:MAG: biopolymer transporter ExbD [Gemmataceae bacterium]|nr:biopolymer transporter ExbD [Gemmataceae bacterium]
MFCRRRQADAVAEIVLPITPMLDMTFQLLTFFIFTYHPAGLEGQMDFSLPGAGSAPAPEHTEIVCPPDVAPEVKSQITVTLKAQRDGLNDGLLSAIIVRPTEGVEVALTGLPALAKYLKDRRDSPRGGAIDDVQIQAESKLKYAFVMEAMDTCVQSGYQRVGFAPPPDLN